MTEPTDAFKLITQRLEVMLAQWMEQNEELGRRLNAMLQRIEALERDAAAAKLAR